MTEPLGRTCRIVHAKFHGDSGTTSVAADVAGIDDAKRELGGIPPAPELSRRRS